MTEFSKEAWQNRPPWCYSPEKGQWDSGVQAIVQLSEIPSEAAKCTKCTSRPQKPEKCIISTEKKSSYLLMTTKKITRLNKFFFKITLCNAKKKRHTGSGRVEVIHLRAWGKTGHLMRNYFIIWKEWEARGGKKQKLPLAIMKWSK